MFVLFEFIVLSIVHVLLLVDGKGKGVELGVKIRDSYCC